jgi:hypothetical protein
MLQADWLFQWLLLLLRCMIGKMLEHIRVLLMLLWLLRLLQVVMLLLSHWRLKVQPPHSFSRTTSSRTCKHVTWSSR